MSGVGRITSIIRNKSLHGDEIAESRELN
ncbi:hypothetical protein PENVUL_c045G09414 [Penicillium vulpinum]|uniref:Uncharacterized protein n=1 Tax=Penicillium vulpinum TaxID=29845 RepID=A0A1V6RG87_9EURO|nr:hypothetical protein PENVUL_c045G09414 [Penicillium vulpinum]